MRVSFAFRTTTSLNRPMRAAVCKSKRATRVLSSLLAPPDAAMACRFVHPQPSIILQSTQQSSSVTRVNPPQASSLISSSHTDSLSSSGASPCSIFTRCYSHRAVTPTYGSRALVSTSLAQAPSNPSSSLHSSSHYPNSCRPFSSSLPASSSSLLSSSLSSSVSPSLAPRRVSPSIRVRQFARASHSQRESPSEVEHTILDGHHTPSEAAPSESTSEAQQNAVKTAVVPAAKALSDDSSTVTAEAGSRDASETKEEVRKTVLAVRRRRAGGLGLTGFGSDGDGIVWSDLLTVPGVGPRNLAKLKARGFREVANLTQLYRDKFAFQESSKGRSAMQEYLQSHVGIIRRDHAARITDFVCLRVAQEEGGGAGADDGGADGEGAGEGAGEAGGGEAEGGAGKGRSLGRHKNRLTFCVEGNISVGKTTFLERIVGDAVKLHDLVEVVPEPVARWQSVGQEKFNILEAFYEEPERYAYTFQNYVFVTRMMQERESAGRVRPIRLMERSVFSDRMVFVRAVHEAKWMSAMEVSIYDSWFDPVVAALPGLVPDGFIYLRANPHTCHQRLKQRARGEEAGVSLDYLTDLHNKHEQWLLPVESAEERPRFSVVQPDWLKERGGRGGGGGGGRGEEDDTPEIIKGRVFALEGEHLHSSIQQVPALVLDCDAQIDLIRDQDAKEMYTKQVQAFFDFVQRRKEQQKQRQRQQRQGAGISPDSPLLIPSTPSLSMPPGISFDPSSLLRA